MNVVESLTPAELAVLWPASSTNDSNNESESSILLASSSTTTLMILLANGIASNSQRQP
ncbi:hypothetical protein [Paraglaciecola sp.]|uniref:hypothetical protein n=1 Tax=Paraglaciecola sp. TaxID=1920173 RepID=UPI00326590C1